MNSIHLKTPSLVRATLVKTPSRQASLSILMIGVALAQWIGTGRGAIAAEPAIDTPWELRPYRVKLLVAFDIPEQTSRANNELLADIRRTAHRCIGPHWQLSTELVSWVQPVSAEGLARLSAVEVRERNDQNEGDFDVCFAATVRRDGSAWRMDVRGWQPEITMESEVVGTVTFDRSDVPLLMVRLCHSAFRPIGLIDDVVEKQAVIVLRAGALPVPDETFSLTKAAEVFYPVLSSRTRDGKIDRLQTIPWTFLSVMEAKGPRLTCALQSGLRSAIGGKQRGRVQTLAIAAKSVFPATQLDLATQAKPSLSLVAHRIELRDSAAIPVADETSSGKGEHLLKVLLTDRRGRVTIPNTAKQSVLWLFAYSGRHLLARVPILPGMTANLRLEVPDDASRLEAESDLQVLQGQLIEAVAARSTAIARVRAAIKKNEADRAKTAAAELRKLPDASFYLDKVIAIRVPSVKAAKARKDRPGEARINRMCDEMNDLIKQYLNEDKRQVVFEELKELQADEAADQQQ